MKICVLITSYNDPRIERTIESLLRQNYSEFWILIADGGSSPFMNEIYTRISNKASERGIDLAIKAFPGSVAETRNSAFEYVLEESKGAEAICLIDTDEIAPPQWLDRLTKPLRTKNADFSFGPTRPVMEGATWVTKYVYFDEARMYRMVKDGLLWYGAMGNSCWSSRMLKALKEKYGYYIDTKLKMGGEDYDLTLRALKEGYKGKFVEEAWVWHDQTKIQTLRDLIRKKRRYLEGAYLSYVRNANFKLESPLKKYFLYGFHPLDLLQLGLSMMTVLTFKVKGKRRPHKRDPLRNIRYRNLDLPPNVVLYAEIL